MEKIDRLVKPAFAMRNACPKCGATTVCMSRFRVSDLLFLAFMMRPVRCQVCFHRWRRLASPFGDLFTRGRRGRI
jgi:ribosomal protein S27E